MDATQMMRDALIDETAKRCAKIARDTARAISKGTHGRMGSAEDYGRTISDEILREFNLTGTTS